jgi:uncharacterized membrane protein
VLLVMVLALRQPFALVGLSWGAAAGVLIAIGLLSYYQALATGPTAVVAPLAASGAVVPVLVDLVRGEFPGVPAMGGVPRCGLLLSVPDCGPAGADRRRNRDTPGRAARLPLPA